MLRQNVWPSLHNAKSELYWMVGPNRQHWMHFLGTMVQNKFGWGPGRAKMLEAPLWHMLAKIVRYDAYSLTPGEYFPSRIPFPPQNKSGDSVPPAGRIQGPDFPMEAPKPRTGVLGPWLDSGQRHSGRPWVFWGWPWVSTTWPGIPANKCQHVGRNEATCWPRRNPGPKSWLGSGGGGF